MIDRTFPALKQLILCTLAVTLAVSVIAVWRGHTGRALADTAVPVSCGVDDSKTGLDSEEALALGDINTYRVTKGLAPLRPDYLLTVSALWKSTDMATHEYLAHDDSFRPWYQRFEDCGYTAQFPYAVIAENLAAGNRDSAQTVQEWEDSPLHNANLLDPRFTAVGIKRAQAPNPSNLYVWYWALAFGSDVDQDLADGIANHQSSADTIQQSNTVEVGN